MPPEKARLLPEGTGKQPIPCMFNPTQLGFSRRNKWEASPRPGDGVPQLLYKGAESGSMRLDLFFDTTDDGSPVTTYTDKLLALMDIDKDLPSYDDQRKSGRPPYVTFQWGEQIQSFKAVITDLSVTFTYFSSTGVPLRATAGVTMTQFQDPNTKPPHNPTSGTPDPHRVHRVQPGETLDRISARYYGDSNRWRLLAQANQIEDPLALRPGALIAIPRVEG